MPDDRPQRAAELLDDRVLRSAGHDALEIALDMTGRV
jgi:hypothetical protein